MPVGGGQRDQLHVGAAQSGQAFQAHDHPSPGGRRVRQIEVNAAGRDSIAGITAAAVSAFQGRQQQCWQRQGVLFMAPVYISGKQQVHQ